MRICFLTQYFPPEVGAAQTRISLLAHALASAGHHVVVHTGFPHYPAGRVIPPYRNTIWMRDRFGAVDVLRSAVYPSANRGVARRLLNHASFALSSMATAPLVGKIDVIVAESPPLFTAAAGMVIARARRTALIVNVADRWPESAVQLGVLQDKSAVALATRLERAIYRSADLITSPTESLVRDLERVAEACGKARRTWPVVDVARFHCGAVRTTSGPLRLLYAGTVGMVHGVQVLVEASRLAGPEVVQTTIAGGGAAIDQVSETVRSQRIENVTVLGIVRPARVAVLLSEADAAAVLLRDLPLSEGALPTKMFEAMASARPVILCARGEAARLVEEQRCGIAVPPEDPGALARAICELQRDRDQAIRLGAAGRHFVDSRLGATYSANEWTDKLTEALARHRHRLAVG